VHDGPLIGGALLVAADQLRGSGEDLGDAVALVGDGDGQPRVGSGERCGRRRSSWLKVCRVTSWSRSLVSTPAAAG
jgi:hypothetical protein